MAEYFQGSAEELREKMADNGIEYAMSIGRRAPMHRMHVDCILEMARAGLKPAIFIGSTNGADSPLFDPVRNPMTVEQQKEQFRFALPGLYYSETRIITLDDKGDNDAWMEALADKVRDAGFEGKAVVHFRTKAADAAQAGADIKPLSHYTESFVNSGFSVWQSFNGNPADDNINASAIRAFDLENLSEEQRRTIAAPDYIVTAARHARDSNPDRDMLRKHNIPLTMFDMTLDRMRLEAGIPTSDVIETAASKGAVTLDSLRDAANDIVKKTRSARPGFDKSLPAETLTLKLASASCNQTAGDWPRNVANICRAIDKAIEDGADILGLEELALTGYERGDDFYYSDNAKTHEMLQLIADYAAARDPNLVISIGHPWYFADKALPDQIDRRKNPIFNRTDNTFNVQTLLSNGEIVSMSAKSYLFNYERGYEGRHFQEWGDALANRYSNEHGKGRSGTITIELPPVTAADGRTVPAKTIPFGSPVVQMGSGRKKVNLYHTICEMYWIGSRFDGSPDNSNYDRDNPLAQKARQFDITVALNPNASPPVINKIDKHYELCQLATRHCGVILHTDGLGSSGSTFAQFGSRLMAQDGKIISEGVRLSMQDVCYTSQTVEVKAPVYKGHSPHALLNHTFTEKDAHTAPVQDGPAAWDKGELRAFEEELRNETLWLFDYMRKCGIPGLMQALSGGADSSYNAAKLRLMVELGCQELGVEEFVDAMGHLPYKQSVLDAFKSGGEKAAVRTFMDHALSCVYMGTDNSSAETLNAARTLIEGGTRADGTAFEGIGGKFHYRNVQRLLDIYAEIYAGVSPSQIDDVREAEIRHEIGEILRLRPEDTTPEELAERVEAFKTMYEEVSHDVLSLANGNHLIPYENIQARLREVLVWLFANVEGKMAIANPNLDEICNSYSTYGGDLHSGSVSGNAHKGKEKQLAHMRLLEKHGLLGLTPVEALHYVNQLQPTAELQPKNKDGVVTQNDEDQLGRSFAQMNILRHYMLAERPLSQNQRKNNPTEVFEKCRAHALFANDNIETLHDKVRINYERWGGNAQAKIHAAPIAMTLGDNVDHQSSLRTPNISANQRPEQAQLALYCLSEIAKRDGITFEAMTGGEALDALCRRALVDGAFAARLSSKMWTPDAIDGRKMKIGTLYKYIQQNGFAPLAAPTAMSDIIKRAASFKPAAH